MQGTTIGMIRWLQGVETIVQIASVHAQLLIGESSLTYLKAHLGTSKCTSNPSQIITSLLRMITYILNPLNPKA